MGGGIRPAKARGPWVGSSGGSSSQFEDGINNSSAEFIDVFIGSDGYAQFNVDHSFQSDFRYYQAFWASTGVETSGDWSHGSGGWTGTSMVNATTWFQRRVRDEFDMIVEVNQANDTGNPIGFQASGAGETAKMTVEYDGGGATHRIRTEFTGESDVLTNITAGTWQLRIRRNQENQVRFYHRQNSSVKWNEIANYTCDLEDNVELALVTSTSNVIRELTYTASVWHENRIYDLTDGATIAVDASRADKFQVTLGGNRTLSNPANPIGDGQTLLFRIEQDGTGGRTLAFDTKYRFPNGQPTLLADASDINYLMFVYHEDDDKWDYLDVSDLIPDPGDLTGADFIKRGIPTFHDEFETAKPFWDDTDAIQSADWQLDIANTRLNGIDDTDTYSWFKRGIEGDIDVSMHMDRNTASSAGMRLSGNSVDMEIRLRDSTTIRVETTGETNVETSDIGQTDAWIRLRWTADGTVTYYYRLSETDNWTQLAQYTGKHAGHDKQLDFNNGDGAYLYAIYIYDNMDTHQIRSLAPKTTELTDAATIAIDASVANFYHVTLAGNRTLGAPANPLGDGQKIMIRVEQDGTGNRTLAYNAIYRFSTDLPSPTLSTGAGDIDYLAFVYHESDNKWDFIGKVFGF